MGGLIVALAVVGSGVGPTGHVPVNHAVDLTKWDRTVFAKPGDHITVAIRRCPRDVEVVGVAYGRGPYQVLHSAVAGRDSVIVVVVVRGQGMVSFVACDGPGGMPEQRNLWIEIGEPRK